MAGTGPKLKLGAIVVGLILGLAGLAPQAAQAEPRSGCNRRPSRGACHDERRPCSGCYEQAPCRDTRSSRPCRGCYERERPCGDCYREEPCREARQPSCRDRDDNADRPCRRDGYSDQPEPCSDCYADDDSRDESRDDNYGNGADNKKNDDYGKGSDDKKNDDDGKGSDEKKKGDDGKGSDDDRSPLRKLLRKLIH